MSTNRRTPLLVAGAFLFGTLGTAAVMSRVRSTTPVAAESAEAQHGNDEHADEHGETEKHTDEEHGEEGHVRLDPAGAKTAGIRVEPARYRPVQNILTVPGTVEASTERVAKITPPVAGRVVRVLVNLGDTVRTGQPLVILDSYEVAQAHAAEHQAESAVQQAKARLETARAEINQAQAGVAQARAEVRQAQTRQSSAQVAVRNQRALARAGAFSQAPLQAAQSELSEAQFELLAAQTEVQTHLVALQRTERLFKEGIASRAELEQAQLEHRQDQARAERARARVENAKQTLARERRVFSGDLLSRQAVQATEAEVRAAEGDVQRARQGVIRAQQDVRRAQKEEAAALTALNGARQALIAARANLYALEGTGHAEGSGGKITLFAPFGGVIAQQLATLGETVERSTTLFLLENLNSVIVQASIPEKEVARVRAGQRVEVTVAAYPNVRFPGTVRTLATRVDEKTRALAARCLVSNQGRRLRPEMFAQVHLAAGPKRSVILVPQNAVVGEEGARAVFVAEGEGYERRTVQVGETRGAQVEIREGLKAGERVVVAGAFVLQSEAQKGELSEGHAH